MDDRRTGSGVSPGTLPDDYYSQNLNTWRDSVRRVLLIPIRWETILIAEAQVSNDLCLLASLAWGSNYLAC